MRDTLLWLYKNANQLNTAFVLQNLAEMCRDAGLTLDEGATVSFIYAGKITNSRATVMFRSGELYYVLDNRRSVDDIEDEDAEEGEEEASQSLGRFWCHRDPESLVSKVIPGGTRRFMGIAKREKRKLKASQKIRLAGVLPFDFVGASEDEQVVLWTRLLQQAEESDSGTLDLSGPLELSQRVLVRANVRSSVIKALIVNNNAMLGSLSLLNYFPRLETLSLWYLDWLTDDGLAALPNLAPGIKVLELHFCGEVTGKCFLHVLKLPKLANLVCNNPTMVFQPSVHEIAITDEEWEAAGSSVHCGTLSTLLIDSGNLTRDFMKGLFPRIPSMTKCMLHADVLHDLQKNSRSGYERETITFHNVDKPEEGFTLHRDVKLINLMRSRVSDMFSVSMLKKIKEIDPSKAEAADALMTNRLDRMNVTAAP